MKRQALIAISCTLLLAGWFLAYLLNSMPQSSRLYIIGPTLLIGVGMGLVRKLTNGKVMAVTVAMTALLALLFYNQLYPRKEVSVAAFRERIQEATSGQLVELKLPPDDKRELSTADYPLEAFADIETSLFARLPGPARMLEFDERGNLFVSIPKLGAIYLLQDSNHDGFAEQPRLFAAELDRPHGLAWRDGRLYVAETSQLLVLDDTDNDLQADQVQPLLTDLPDDGGHWTRSLVFAPEGSLYLSIGSRCNACEESDPRRAAILKIDPQTGQSQIFASGLRNAVGLAIAPDTGLLWASENGRDMLGDSLPPDEINQVNQNGNYGWPFCFGQNLIDGSLANPQACQQALPSTVDLPAHSAPLGIAFGHNLKAPQEYRNSLYVALHGSWNRSTPIGYQLIRIPYKDGKMENYGKEFVSGWLQQGKAWGRPVAPKVGPDGNLYLSDDRANVIYRIHWKSQE